MIENKHITLKGDILTLKYDYPIRIGFLPDIHAGETRSVCTPTFTWYDAGQLPQTWKANEVQLMLYRLWKRNIELFKIYGVQHIFVIGDAFGGKNWAEGGAYMFINRPQQIQLAADLLEEVWEGLDKKVDFFIWSGTGYHEAKLGDANMHNELVKELNRRTIPAVYMGSGVSYVELQNGKRMRRLFISHEAPMALVHPATLMSRDINWALQAEASGTTLPVDAIIRAHLHHWIHVDHSGKHALQLPCWLGHVPYKNTIRYFFKLQPTIGGAMMLVDEYGRLDFWGGSYPFSFNKTEYLEFHKLCVTMTKIKGVGIETEIEPESINRPSCPRCSSLDIISRGIQWHCKKCGRYWKK